jgi:hypothetical protein
MPPCTDNKAKFRYPLKNTFTQTLRHTPHNPYHQWLLTFGSTEQPRFAQSFILSFAPHTAGVDDHHVGIVLIIGSSMTNRVK